MSGRQIKYSHFFNSINFNLDLRSNLIQQAEAEALYIYMDVVYKTLSSIYSALDSLSVKIKRRSDYIVVFTSLVMLSGLFFILCNLIDVDVVHR